MDDWLGEISEIRDQAIEAAKDREKTLDLSVLKREKKRRAADILKVIDAHNALRKVNSVLLNRKGVIDFQVSEQYDNSIALIWQGPLNKPRKPSHNDVSDLYCILIGTKDKKAFVNGKALQFNTPEDLKAALVQAAKRPGRKSRG